MIPVLPGIAAVAPLIQGLPRLIDSLDSHAEAKQKRTWHERQRRLDEYLRIAEVAINCGPHVVTVVMEADNMVAKARVRRYEKRLAHHLGRSAHYCTLLENADAPAVDAAELAKWRRRMIEHQAEAADYQARLQAMHIRVATAGPDASLPDDTSAEGEGTTLVAA